MLNFHKIKTTFLNKRKGVKSNQIVCLGLKGLARETMYDMVIILCVYVFAKFWENYEHSLL